MLEAIPKQAGIFRSVLKSEARGGKGLESPAANQKAHQEERALAWSPGLSGQAAVFAECVDTLGLVIRMMKLGVSSVPRPSKHTSEPAQTLPLCCCVGPLWAQSALKEPLGCCRGG